MSSLPLRDWAVLAELNTSRFLALGQLEELLFAASTLGASSRTRIALRILRRLRSRGLVGVRPRLPEGLDGVPGHVVYSLTAAGRRLVGSVAVEKAGGATHTGTLLVGHALMVAEVGLCFRRAARA